MSAGDSISGEEVNVDFCYTAKGNRNSNGNQILEWYSWGRSLREISALCKKKWGRDFSYQSVRRFLINEGVYLPDEKRRQTAIATRASVTPRNTDA